MRAPMWTRLVVLVAMLAAGCGSQIGDACVLSTRTATPMARGCAITTLPDGYCTVMGCDYQTCPGDNTVCVSFFTGQFANLPCVYATEDQPGGTNDCSPDEECDLDDHCVARSSEVRYCMATCESNSDCRSGYECRNLTLMMEHGGEPVLARRPVRSRALAPNFCAEAPAD